ncbi:MAG TPA: hypothetical protein VHZ95_16745 [Polyangiales bacterium]|nr:hypothetical protein [Polyangiales bacterium]
MYDGADDPWGFDTRWDERRNYALTLEACRTNATPARSSPAVRSAR